MWLLNETMADWIRMATGENEFFKKNWWIENYTPTEVLLRLMLGAVRPSSLHASMRISGVTLWGTHNDLDRSRLVGTKWLDSPFWCRRSRNRIDDSFITSQSIGCRWFSSVGPNRSYFAWSLAFSHLVVEALWRSPDTTCYCSPRRRRRYRVPAVVPTRRWTRSQGEEFPLAVTVAFDRGRRGGPKKKTTICFSFFFSFFSFFLYLLMMAVLLFSDSSRRFWRSVSKSFVILEILIRLFPANWRQWIITKIHLGLTVS